MGATLEVVNEQADRRRRVPLLAFAVDLVHQFGQRHIGQTRDFMPFQNDSSRLTLVLRPATTIERFAMGDFMTPFHFRSSAVRSINDLDESLVTDYPRLSIGM